MLNSKERLLEGMVEIDGISCIFFDSVVDLIEEVEARIEEVDDDCANLSTATKKHIGKMTELNEITTDILGTFAALAEQFNKRITRLEAQAAMLQAHIDLLVAASTRVKDDSPANRAAYRSAINAYRTAADYYVSLEEPE